MRTKIYKIKTKSGKVTGYLKLYWSETLKKYVTIPED